MHDDTILSDDFPGDTPPTAASEPAEETEDLRSRLRAAESGRSAAIEAYREALLASEPLVSPELVTGTTVEDVRASFEAASGQVRRVRETVRREQAAVVPAGAPGRLAQQPASAFEKIRRGLEQLARG
jgi:hypothetical protein